MDHVIRCSEKWAAFDPNAVAQFGQDSFFLGRDLGLAQDTSLSCQYTPAGVTYEGSDPQPGSLVPVLIWNGDLDPIDPPENMAGAQDLWPNSIALVSPYQGHNFSDSATVFCFSSILVEFIRAGTIDALDTSCLQRIPPPSFVVP